MIDIPSAKYSEIFPEYFIMHQVCCLHVNIHACIDLLCCSLGSDNFLWREILTLNVRLQWNWKVKPFSRF